MELAMNSSLRCLGLYVVLKHPVSGMASSSCQFFKVSTTQNTLERMIIKVELSELWVTQVCLVSILQSGLRCMYLMSQKVYPFRRFAGCGSKKM